MSEYPCVGFCTYCDGEMDMSKTKISYFRWREWVDGKMVEVREAVWLCPVCESQCYYIVEGAGGMHSAHNGIVMRPSDLKKVAPRSDRAIERLTEEGFVHLPWAWYVDESLYNQIPF